MPVGAHDISTLLAARFQSAADYGLSTIADILAADRAAHNAVVTEMMTDLAAVTTDRQRIYGSSIGGEMRKVDEYARSATQKAKPGSDCGFPLDLFQYGIGWTSRYMIEATPADLAISQQAAQKAHLRAIRREIKQSIFRPTNRTYIDLNVDNIPLAIKAFVNADSASIPDSPDGASFNAATHTHYNAEATLSAAGLTASVQDLIEHGHGNNVKIAINFNDEAAFRALTGFVPAPDFRVVPATTAAYTAKTTNPGNLYNRYIGVFGAAEVWIKPWAIANYAFIWDSGADEKPLVFRQKSAGALQGLRVAAELETHPLYAEYMEALFGVAPWTRTNGVIHYFASGTYAAPTIT